MREFSTKVQVLQSHRCEPAFHRFDAFFTVILAERGRRLVTKEMSDWKSAGWNQFERIEKKKKKMRRRNH